jgi:uncharacterized protein (TIGR03086 family)
VSDNSDKYRRAVNGFSAVVETVPGDAWSATSPCDAWTAKDVVGHVIIGMQRVAGRGPGGGPAGSSLDPADEPVDSYVEARNAAFAALTEENLAKTVDGPTGEIPLAELVGTFATMDVLIHTWDLAQAAGIAVTLDEDLVEEAYDRLLPVDAMIRTSGVFGPKLDPPAGADLQTKLMYFTGRQA